MVAPKPRKLRLLRIDDDMRPDDIERLEQHFTIVRVPDRHGFSHDGIVGWASALSFWGLFDKIDPIDIIVSDVKFVDPTSPVGQVKLWGETLDTPNGLSYFIPLAAVARASGAPLGVALHTAQPSHWQTRAMEGSPLAVQTMSLFAAHQVGLLAAILNDRAPTSVEECWSYIEGKAADHPEHASAVCTALRDFRKKLGSMYVMPDAWRQLSSWCREQFALAGQHDGVRLTSDIDPGLRFMRSDGEEDWISLRSLFADTPLTDVRFDFDLTKLPAGCFELEAPADPGTLHNLDSSLRPKIGPLVHHLGKLSEAYEEALQILDQFPLDPISKISLWDYEKEASPSALGVLLAIVFQDLNLRCERRREWHRLYTSQSWDITTRSFDNEGRRSLKELIDGVQSDFKARQIITLDQIEDSLGQRAKVTEPDASVPFVVTILKSIGKIAAAADKTYSVLADGVVLTLPEMPRSLPKGFEDICVIKYDGDARTRNGVLAQFFGFGDHDPDRTKHLRRLIAIFLTGNRDRAEVGTQFLERYYAGKADGWIKRLCREYLRSQGWTDEKAWPALVQTRDRQAGDL